MPLENMCWPQTQKPKRPTPHNANTTQRSLQTGLLENVAIKCVVSPKQGSMATYTWACAKNQKRRCQSTGCAEAATPAGWLATKLADEKNCVLSRRSESKQRHAARRMLKINIPRTALMNQAQTVIGSRGRVIPGARRSMVVTVKFNAVRRDAAQKIATLTSQSVMPEVGAVRKAIVMPKSEATVAQKESRFSKGKAISRAPIWRGRK